MSHREKNITGDNMINKVWISRQGLPTTRPFSLLDRILYEYLYI